MYNGPSERFGQLVNSSSSPKEEISVDLMVFIRECGWQVILAAILVVQFLIIQRLRGQVRRLQELEWYVKRDELPSSGAARRGRPL